MLQPWLPTADKLLILSTDRSLIKGSPILTFWHPLNGKAQNGVMEVVNIDMFTALMLEPVRPWVTRATLNIAGSHLEYGKGLLAAITVDNGLVSYDLASEKFPFSISTVGSSASLLALKKLPT